MVVGLLDVGLVAGLSVVGLVVDGLVVVCLTWRVLVVDLVVLGWMVVVSRFLDLPKYWLMELNVGFVMVVLSEVLGFMGVGLMVMGFRVVGLI